MASRLAQVLGRPFSPHKVSRVELGQDPDKDTVRAYGLATEGAVTAADFFVEEQPRTIRRRRPAAPAKQGAAA